MYSTCIPCIWYTYVHMVYHVYPYVVVLCVVVYSHRTTDRPVVWSAQGVCIPKTGVVGPTDRGCGTPQMACFGP